MQFYTEYRYPTLSIDTLLRFETLQDSSEYRYPLSSIDTLSCRSAFNAGRKLPNGSIDDLTYQNVTEISKSQFTPLLANSIDRTTQQCQSSIGAEYAELMAIRLALSIFIEANCVGKTFLIVESDSQVVINWIANMSSRPWRWWNIFKELDVDSRFISKVKILYVPRTHNKLADNLAKTRARRSDLFKW
ncbi:hypothetical protein GQ457_10G006130 [Hibiscus cannabinus]